mmetsp:Transcript_4434/g.10091  ORF Transcript_4434/g.10091 Transcript_4434/m.10091 type:complete len:197 (-) Transcript_4434:425-1015(-)
MSSRDNSQGDEVMENDRSSSGADPFSQGVNRQNEDGDDDREERVVDDDDVDVEEEEEEGEDLMDMNQMREDYRAIDAMDHYGEEGIDDAFADQRSEGQLAVDRRAADAELDRRDRRRARGQRLPGALAAGDEEDDVEEARRARRRRRARLASSTSSSSSPAARAPGSLCPRALRRSRLSSSASAARLSTASWPSLL